MTTTVLWPDHERLRARLDTELERLLGVLDTRPDIVEVWLHGSSSDPTSSLHRGSDLDLVVVLTGSGNPVERALDLRRFLAPRVALDLVVYDPDQFAAGGRFIDHVRRQGRRLR